MRVPIHGVVPVRCEAVSRLQAGRLARGTVGEDATPSPHLHAKTCASTGRFAQCANLEPQQLRAAIHPI